MIKIKVINFYGYDQFNNKIFYSNIDYMLDYLYYSNNKNKSVEIVLVLGNGDKIVPITLASNSKETEQLNNGYIMNIVDSCNKYIFKLKCDRKFRTLCNNEY